MSLSDTKSLLEFKRLLNKPQAKAVQLYAAAKLNNNQFLLNIMLANRPSLPRDLLLLNSRSKADDVAIDFAADKHYESALYVIENCTIRGNSLENKDMYTYTFMIVNFLLDNVDSDLLNRLLTNIQFRNHPDYVKYMSHSLSFFTNLYQDEKIYSEKMEKMQESYPVYLDKIKEIYQSHINKKIELPEAELRLYEKLFNVKVIEFKQEEPKQSSKYLTHHILRYDKNVIPETQKGKDMHDKSEHSVLRYLGYFSAAFGSILGVMSLTTAYNNVVSNENVEQCVPEDMQIALVKKNRV